MATLRAEFQRLFFPGLEELIFRSYREKTPQFEPIFNVKSSDAAFEEDFTAAGTGLFVRTPENTESAEDKFYPGYSIRYDHFDYLLRMGFSHQFMRDGKYNIWGDRSKDMGFSARQTREVLVADVFNNGFTANGYDGVPLFSASHPLIRGGGPTGQVQSNVLPNVSTLSVISYRAMLTLFRKQFDETGVRRIALEPEVLVVSPDYEFDALEIVKSAGRPDTANRADNVTRQRTSVTVWDYLLNAHYWFMGVAKGQHKLKVFNREMFHVMEFEDEKARVNWIQAAFAFSYGYSQYLGWFGTNPL